MRPICLITGGSAGIGAATARLLARHGYDLTLTYNSDPSGAQSVAGDAQAAGANVQIVQCDVAEPDQISTLFQALDAHHGRIDALVNNAGVVDVAMPVTGFSHARLRRMFDINVIGAMLVAKEAVIRMQAQANGGAIVNVSSAAARLGSAHQYVDYAASKAAIDIFTKGLADEVAQDNIRVTAVRPGLIETDIHAKGGQPDRAEQLAGNIPMQRPGSAEEVAESILWLLSQKASYVTGTCLDVSGGR